MLLRKPEELHGEYGVQYMPILPNVIIIMNTTIH